MLKELMGLILIYGGIVQVFGLYLAGDPAGFTVGLWVGVALALFMIWHMNRSLGIALDLDEKGATAYTRKAYGIRLLLIVAVLVAENYLPFGSVVATFIGMFGLKFAAYLQPIWENRRLGKEQERG